MSDVMDAAQAQKEISDLMQTRIMLGMDGSQGISEQKLHQRKIANWLHNFFFVKNWLHNLI